MALPVVTNKSPTAAAIAWQAFSIQYMGVGYSIPAGSTTMRWVFWRYNNGSPVLDAANDLPTNLTDDDLVLLGNRNGIALRVQSANIVDGELIIDGSIFADALAANIISAQHIVTEGLDAGVIKFGSMHGDRIQVGTLNADRIVVRGAVSAQDRALIDYTEDRAQSAYNEAVKYLTSKGTDLVTNGSGFLKTNYNFSWADFNQADAPNGAVGSFVTKTTVQQVRRIDEYIPYDPTKAYRFSFQARQTVSGATNRLYGSVTPYDAFGNVISPSNSHFWGGTTTKLARELKNGDTEIWLQDDATEWWGGPVRSAGSSSQNRVMIIWDWVDPAGKVWPAQTYSRNYILRDLWADGGISGKVITLRAPWAGGTYPVGCSVSNGSNPNSAGIYTPFANNTPVPEAWTSYSGVLKAGAPSITETPGVVNNFGWTQGLPRGTAQVDVGFLLNYPANPSNSIVGRHAVAGVSFSDAAAASADAYDAYVRWAPQGVTTIDGGKITADSINAAQINANAISASELAANAVTAVKILAGAVIAEKIAANAVIAEKIMASAVIAEKIATNAVTADKIIANAVTADKIIAGAVTALKIATDAVEADKIKANAVTTAKIEALAVVADKIAANAVNAEKVAAGAITTIKLDALAVTAEKVAANAITAAKIKAGEINTDHMTVGTIKGDRIEVGSLNGDRITVNTMNANRIDTATITADFLKANAAFITALQTVDLTATTLTGPKIQTGASGRRIVLQNVGANGQLEFWGETATAEPATITGFVEESRQSMKLTSGRTSTGAGTLESEIVIRGGTSDGTDGTERRVSINTDLLKVNSNLVARQGFFQGGSDKGWDVVANLKGILVQSGSLTVRQGGVVIDQGGLSVVGASLFDGPVSFQRSKSSLIYGMNGGYDSKTANNSGEIYVAHGLANEPNMIQVQLFSPNYSAHVSSKNSSGFFIQFRTRSNNSLAPSGTSFQYMWFAASIA